MDEENIGEIISKKHKKFLETTGSAIQKVSADHHLLLHIVSSKIRFIVEIMVREEVIDTYSVVDKRGSHTFTLIKNDLNADAEVFTNGEYISMLSGSDHNINTLSPYRNIVYPNSTTGYDWDQFAEELMNFVHNNMYKSKEALEVNFEMLLEEEKIK